MKSFAYYRHEIVYGFIVFSMIAFTIACRSVSLPERKLREIEDVVFGWVERGHVDE